MGSDPQRLIQALIAAQQSVTRAPTDPQAHYQLAICYQRVGASWEATQSLLHAARIDPKDTRFWLALGSTFEAMGDEWPALLALRHCTDSLEGLSRLARVALSLGLAEEGAASAGRILESDAENARAHLLLGECLEEMGQDSEHVQRSYELDPSLRESHRMTRVTRLRHLGRFSEAEDLLREAIAGSPANGAAYWALVSGRRMGPSDHELIARIEELAATSSPAQSVSFHFALGKARDDLGEYELAMRSYDAANRITLQFGHGGRSFDPAAFVARFDRLIEMFSPRFLENHRGLGSTDETPLFLMGMMRSGTTLAEQILSAHRSVAARGELGHWPHHGQAILDLDNKRLRTDPLRHATDEYSALIAGIREGHQRVTDKNPANSLLAGVLSIAFPAARMIRMERHPIDTCLSIWFTPASRPAEFANDREHLVLACRQFRRLMQHWEEVLSPDRFRTFSYEGLVRDPEKVTREMVSFAGLPWDEACLRPEQNPNRVATPSLWQVRQPIHTGSVDRWRRYEPCLGEFAELS